MRSRNTLSEETREEKTGLYLGVGRLEVRGVLGQPLAQLGVHGTVLRLIESFFEYLRVGG